jgi:hypothetical protein
MNQANFKQVVDYLKANPGEWERDDIYGRKSFAGHAQRLAGLTFNRHSSWNTHRDGAAFLEMESDEAYFCFWKTRTIEDFEFRLTHAYFNRSGHAYGGGGFDSEGFDRDGRDDQGRDADDVDQDGVHRP